MVRQKGQNSNTSVPANFVFIENMLLSLVNSMKICPESDQKRQKNDVQVQLFHKEKIFNCKGN